MKGVSLWIEMDGLDGPSTFDRADYCLVLPLALDKYGMPTAESYKLRVKVTPPPCTVDLEEHSTDRRIVLLFASSGD